LKPIPPFYHFLLRVWARLTGSSVFALRFLSLVLGVLTVALGGAHPTTEWQLGEIVCDNYGLLIAPDTPPGAYLLEVGMYYLADPGPLASAGRFRRR